jgi:hypothetical protein
MKLPPGATGKSSSGSLKSVQLQYKTKILKVCECFPSYDFSRATLVAFADHQPYRINPDAADNRPTANSPNRAFG